MSLRRKNKIFHTVSVLLIFAVVDPTGPVVAWRG